jgi:ADP-ribose pyrophosphatase
MKAWKRIDPTVAHKVGWRQITSKTFLLPDGKKEVFDTMYLDGQEFACVIALTPERKVVIARQFRPGPEKVMDDIPGGFVDKGEDPETAMRRELLEETGYEAGEVTYLGLFHKDVYMNATWHAYVAKDCRLIADPQLGYTEHVEVDLISIEQLIENAKHDRMQDHAAVLMAYDLLKSQQSFIVE